MEDVKGKMEDVMLSKPFNTTTFQHFKKNHSNFQTFQLYNIVTFQQKTVNSLI
jgi:hypothetical protein